MHGMLLVPGMEPYPPRMALAPRTPTNQHSASVNPGDHRVWSRDGTLSPPGAAGSTNPSQSVIIPWAWGFHTVRGGIDPGGPFRARVLELYIYGGISDPGWDLILPGYRWLHDPQPISNQPVRWGFHTVRGGIDAGDHRIIPGFLFANV